MYKCCQLQSSHDCSVNNYAVGVFVFVFFKFELRRAQPKLQAMVYDIIPSTTALFSYAIGSRKLSANEQFFVGAQTVVSLLQTTQIKQGVSFIAANKVYTSTSKTTIVWIETVLFLFFTRGGCVSCLHVCLGARLLLRSHISTHIFWRVLTALLDSCVKIKECPFSGVTKSDRVWRKVPESDARSVGTAMSLCSLPMKCKKTLVHNVTDTSAKNAGFVHHIKDTDCQHSQCFHYFFIFLFLQIRW